MRLPSGCAATSSSGVSVVKADVYRAGLRLPRFWLELATGLIAD
jgi:hypothetical protein